jgi:hypothetical protein
MVSLLASWMVASAVTYAQPSLSSVRVLEKVNYRRVNRQFSMGGRLFNYGHELDADHPSMSLTNLEDCLVSYKLDGKKKILVAYIGVRDTRELSANARYNKLTVILDGRVAYVQNLYGADVKRLVLDVTNDKLLTFRAPIYAMIAESQFLAEKPEPQPGDVTGTP